MYEQAKNGKGEAEETGYTIKNGVVQMATVAAKVAVGLTAGYVAVKVLEVAATILSDGLLAWTLAL